MQGFLFSGAKPAREIDSWLTQVVLPRKAAWIEAAAGADNPADDAPHAAVSAPGALAA
jgi:hypothetical protein